MQWDLDLLKEKFDVRLVKVCYGKSLLKRTLKTHLDLISGIAWADVVFCWFANYEAFVAIALSQVLNKKTAVVVGGQDVTTIPELEYGLALHRRTHFYQLFALTRAMKVLPISRDAEKGALRFLRDATKVTLIYLGVDLKRFQPSDTKRSKAITVGAVNRRNLDRKGLESFVKSAAYLPGVEFVLIGQFQDSAIDYLRSIATKNVRFAGFLPESELIRQYQQAKVYVQVSAHEAFGVPLAEAMACECVPVVTDRGAIPEVVGETGIYVPYGDAAATAEGIKRALESNNGIMARTRVEEMFTFDKRRKELLKAINDLFC